MTNVRAYRPEDEAPQIVDNNSRYSPMGANEEFIGEWDDNVYAASLSFFVKTDAPGTLYLESSALGEVTDRSLPIPVFANLDFFAAFGGRAGYGRVRYVNGPTPSTYMVLQAIRRPYTVNASMVPLYAPIPSYGIGQVTRAVVAAQDNDGFSRVVGRDPDGGLLVHMTNQAKNYLHLQPIPEDVWTVVHNLGFHPNITVVNSAGQMVVGEVVYLDVNTAQLTFSGAFAGSAFCS